MSEEFLTIGDAAKVIGISDNALRRHIRRGLLPTFIVKKWEITGDKKMSIPKDDVQAVRLSDIKEFARFLVDARRLNPTGDLCKLREVIKGPNDIIETPSSPVALGKSDL